MSLGLSSGSVELAPPDPTWAVAFAAERARLVAAVRPLPLTLEHVGSTAVPGLPAKPILDLLGGHPPGADPVGYVAACEAAGFTYRGEYGVPGRHYFVRDDAAGRRTHHLHLVAEGGALWRSHLAFRDYLRQHPARAAEYTALKSALAARFPADRPAYTEGKAAFITETLRLAGAPPTA
jgi:GrpB-like predicted nucleotidyltransferase (UPF0157 family)